MEISRTLTLGKVRWNLEQTVNIRWQAGEPQCGVEAEQLTRRSLRRLHRFLNPVPVLLLIHHHALCVAKVLNRTWLRQSSLSLNCWKELEIDWLLWVVWWCGWQKKNLSRTK